MNLSGVTSQNSNALVQKIFGQDIDDSVVSQQEGIEEEEKQSQEEDYNNLGMKYFYEYQKNQYKKSYESPGYLESLYS